MGLEENFDALADADMWLDLATIGAGYMGASLTQTLIDERVGFDLPNEGYGVGFMFAGLAVDVEYSDNMAMRGGLYTLDALGQRFGLKNKVTEVA